MNANLYEDIIGEIVDLQIRFHVRLLQYLQYLCIQLVAKESFLLTAEDPDSWLQP